MSALSLDNLVYCQDVQTTFNSLLFLTYLWQGRQPELGTSIAQC